MTDTEMKVSKVGNHVEVLRPEHSIQIEFRNDGKVLWVNVDGQCVLRISQIPKDPNFSISMLYPGDWEKNLVETDGSHEVGIPGKAAQVGGGKTQEQAS